MVIIILLDSKILFSQVEKGLQRSVDEDKERRNLRVKLHPLNLPILRLWMLILTIHVSVTVSEMCLCVHVLRVWHEFVW